jgi:hypothetical protein
LEMLLTWNHAPLSWRSSHGHYHKMCGTSLYEN